jgi:hypothetical protein
MLLHSLAEEKLMTILTESHAIIAGGALRAVFCDKPISDYDCYFTRQEDLQKALDYFDNEENGANKIFETENATSYIKGKAMVQLIKKFVLPNIQDLLDQFDFTVCMAAFDVFNERLYVADDFLKHNCQKRLVYNPKAQYPLASLARIKKYTLKYGYTISGTELVKLGLCLNKLRLDTFADLKEQLMGIDTLLLKELTDKLDEEDMKFKQYNFDEFMYMIEEYLDDGYEKLMIEEE